MIEGLTYTNVHKTHKPKQHNLEVNKKKSKVRKIGKANKQFMKGRGQEGERKKERERKKEEQNVKEWGKERKREKEKEREKKKL